MKCVMQKKKERKKNHDLFNSLKNIHDSSFPLYDLTIYDMEKKKSFHILWCMYDEKKAIKREKRCES